jgi:hypothetical protein
MTALSRKRLIDKLVEAYVDWREACARVNDSYRSWANETGRRGAVAFGRYMAALDAEADAAEAYAAVVRRADNLPRSHERPLEPLDGPAWDAGWP